MNTYIKKIIQYAAGKAANSILLLLLLPVFSRFLLPEEYAVYTNVMLFYGLAALVYILGIQQAMYSYFHDQDEKEYRATLISTVFITLMSAGLIFSILIIIFREQLSILIVRDASYSHLFIWISIILFFNNITAITLSILNIMELAGRFAILGVVQNGSNFLLLLAGGILGKFTIDYVFLSLIISTLLSSITALKFITGVYRENRTGGEDLFSVKIMLPLLRFGLIMIPGTLAVIAMRAADRLMLAHLSANGMYDVGIYAVGYKIGSIMIFLITMMNTVFLPYAMRISKQEKAKEIYRRIFDYYIFGGGLLGVAIIMFSPEIFKVFIDSNYQSAAAITYIGVISTYLQGVFNLVNVTFYANKKAGNIAFAVIAGAVINIVLNYFLIPKHGIMGAGAASIVAYLFTVIVNYAYGEMKYKSGFKGGYMLITLPLMGFCAFIITLINLNVLTSLIKLVILVVLGLIMLQLLKKKNEWNTLKEMIRRDS